MPRKRGRKSKPVPLYIYWEFPPVRTPDGQIPGYSVVRKSANYIQLAMFLVNNPPDQYPFKPSSLPGGYMNALNYRKDVVNWVSRRMIVSLQLHKDLDEEDHFSDAIKALHQLRWSPGSPWRGFYLVMPNPQEIKPAERDDLWGLKGLDKGGLTYYKAKGLGTWAEPDFLNMERWEARKAILGVLHAWEYMAEAALTGRKIALLEPQQARAYLRGTIDALARALPQLEEKKDQDKK
jgi:hypothetical protein